MACYRSKKLKKLKKAKEASCGICEAIEEVDCLQERGFQVAADGGYEKHVGHKIYEGYKLWRAMKSVLSNRGMWVNVNKTLHEVV